MNEKSRGVEKVGGEYRVFGPPGTGKTTYLVRQIEKAAKKFGADNVLVSSFTKAAARNLVGKELPIPESAVGTLHAHCYRALGRPKIADAYLREFGEAAGMLLTGVGTAPSIENSSDRPAGTTQDDEMYLEYSRCRNLMREKKMWAPSVVHFGKLWEEWKKEHDMLDFTDLIEVGAREMLYAPGNAQVLMIDEVQDCTPLQLKLIRSWGKSAQFFILAGDDDQSIYGWLGARPEALVGDDFPGERKIFLTQSWRVPRKVQAYAEHIIAKVGMRQAKTYLPRDEEGSVETMLGIGWKNPRPMVGHIEKDLDDGLTVMVLAPCAYALGPIIKELRECGIPFGNPLRQNRADWNPLVLSDKRESSLGRLRDFLEPKHELRVEESVSKVWSAKQLMAWTKLVDNKEWFGKGFKAHLKRMVESESGDTAQGVLEALWQFGQDREYLSRLITLVSTGTKLEGLRALHGNLMPDAKINVHNTLYAMKCLERVGGEPGDVNPKVLVGTIHSVKGGQADSVYIIPDVPESVYQGTTYSREEYDASIRLAYVAVTRAKKKIAILRRETRFTIRGLFG